MQYLNTLQIFKSFKNTESSSKQTKKSKNKLKAKKSMFLKKATQLFTKNAFFARMSPEALLAQQSFTHNRISMRKCVQYKPSFSFAVISQTQIDEVMQLYSNLRQKPIDYIYSESLKVVSESTDNIKSYLILNLITRAALEAKQFDKAIEFSLKQIEYLKKEETQSLQIATCLYDLSVLYFQKQKMTQAFKYAFEAEEMADSLYQDNVKDHEHIFIQTNNNIANLFLHSQNFEKSLDYTNIVVKMEVEDNTQNLLQQFTALNLQTQSYQSMQNEQQAHLAAEKAYILAKKKNLESHRAYLFATVGYIFTELKQFDRAKSTLNEAIEIYRKTQGNGSRNITNLQQKVKEIEEMEKIQNMNLQSIQPIDSTQTEAKQQAKKQQQKAQSEGQPEEDLATTYFKNGMYKEAQAEFEKSIQLIDQVPQNERKQYKGTLLNRIFTCQYLQNKFDDSLVTALESLECVIDDENVSKKIKAFQNVGIAYEKTGDIIKSIEYFKKTQELFDEKSPNLDRYQVLVNLMRLHKVTHEFDESVKYGELILQIVHTANLADIEIGRFKSGLSEAYYLNHQYEESYRMGESALKIIEKVENGSKSHLYCCFQLLKAYEDGEYIERVEKTAKTCLELHEKLFGKNVFDDIKYQTYKTLANFYIIFGKYDQCMNYLNPLIDFSKNSVEQTDEYISFLILKAQLQQSLEEFFNALELTKNIFEIVKESNNGRIPFTEDTAKLYTLRYQLQYQNMNMPEFANNLMEYLDILNRESQEKGYLTNHIIQANAVVNQFLTNHQSEYPEICQQLQKYK